MRAAPGRLLARLLPARRRGGGAPLARRAPSARDLDAAAALVERLLVENVVPFWEARALDAEAGGYRLHHDAAGEWKGPAPKRLVTQARTLWFFSRLAASPYGDPAHLEAARAGFVFLRDRLWDREHGGFVWEVDPAGGAATDARKHAYGQAFAIYALAEYALASRDAEPAELARATFALLERHAHDPEFGGYRECLERDWRPAPDAAPGCLGLPAGRKLMNTHLHLLEALARYLALGEEGEARRRLVELLLVLTSAVVRKRAAVCTDEHLRDWTPLAGSRQARVSYGHQLETAWLVLEACAALGLPAGPVVDLSRALFEECVRRGFDAANGGFHASGPIGRPADRLEKVWWVQAEALLATLRLYRTTGDPRCWDAFVRTLEWIGGRQADWEVGEWHAEVRDGRAGGDKAGPWRGPYHTGRALLECARLLAEVAPPGWRAPAASETG